MYYTITAFHGGKHAEPLIYESLELVENALKIMTAFSYNEGAKTLTHIEIHAFWHDHVDCLDRRLLVVRRRFYNFEE